MIWVPPYPTEVARISEHVPALQREERVRERGGNDKKDWVFFFTIFLSVCSIWNLSTNITVLYFHENICNNTCTVYL
jgi:hypothetical protein